MDSLIKIGFVGDSEKRLIAKLEEKGPLIIQVLATKLNLLMLQLQQYVVREKLSGQILHQRSGTLKDSVRALPVELQGTTITGTVEAGGGAAFYGRFHEYGAVFDVKNRGVKHVAGKTRAGFMFHAAMRSGRPVVIPARPFMRPSLAENAAMIERELKEILDEELAK
jgi:phage gpG-like protein